MAGIVKDLMVKEYKEALASSDGFILTEYVGLTVEEVDRLRRGLESQNINYKVLKNRIANIVFKEQKIEGFEEVLKGSSAILIPKDKEKMVDTAKVIVKFEKDSDFLKIKCGYVDGEVFTREKIIELSKIPSREVLIAQILMCLQSPISGVVNVLSGVTRNLVYALNAIKDKKE
jgi:large subunit ribosomal protein L10